MIGLLVKAETGGMIAMRTLFGVPAHPFQKRRDAQQQQRVRYRQHRLGMETERHLRTADLGEQHRLGLFRYGPSARHHRTPNQHR